MLDSTTFFSRWSFLPSRISTSFNSMCFGKSKVRKYRTSSKIRFSFCAYRSNHGKSSGCSNIIMMIIVINIAVTDVPMCLPLCVCIRICVTPQFDSKREDFCFHSLFFHFSFSILFIHFQCVLILDRSFFFLWMNRFIVLLLLLLLLGSFCIM